MNDMKRLLSYAGPYKRDMIFGAVLVLIETCFELFIPILISNLIDIGVANGDIPYIYRKGIQMGICALCALVTGILYAHFAARATYGWGAEIRKAEYEKMQQYAFSNLDHFAVSSLITRMTTDVTVIQNMVSAGFRPITRGPSLLIMGIGLSFYMNPRLAFVFLVCTPLLGFILSLIVRRVAPMYTKLQSMVDRLNNVVQEGLTAIRAVKAFVRDEYEEDKFNEVKRADVPLRRAESAGISGRHVYRDRADSVVRRKYDSEKTACRRKPDRISKLRHAGHELDDDDCKRLPAPDPFHGERTPDCRGAR